MILVTGAGGKTGRAVIKALADRGEAVHAFVHRADHITATKALGAREAAAGDLRDEAALGQAVAGARAVYHICPNVSPDELEIGKTVIDAACSAAVQHFVFHSALHPQAEAMPHHWNKLRVEEALFESGLPFTILQPTAYMQNILAVREGILAGVYTVPYPVETRLSLVDLNDVAEAAAVVLTEGGHTRATYELVGTKAMTQVEVAETLGQQLGIPVRAEAISVEAWTRQVRQTGMGDYQVETLAAMFRYYASYGLWGNSNVLGWILRRAPASLPAFVAQAWSENFE